MNVYSPTHRRVIPPQAVLSIYFGGMYNQLCWALLLFGLSLSLGFLRHSEVVFLFLREGEVLTVTGTLREVQSTSFSENKMRIQKYLFEFPWNGKTEKGVSFNKGKSLTAGDALTVRVPTERPELAVIEGFRRKPFGKAIGVLAIFPLAALALLVWGVLKSTRLKKVLEVGVQTVGHLRERQATNTQINKKTVFRYIFEFKSPDGQTRRVTACSHLWGDLEVGTEQKVVYDPSNPEQAYLISKIPIEINLDSRPEMEVKGFSPFILILPSCCSLLLYLLFR